MKRILKDWPFTFLCVAFLILQFQIIKQNKLITLLIEHASISSDFSELVVKKFQLDSIKTK